MDDQTRIPAVTARTVAEVFQETARRSAERIAIRTLGDTTVWTWAEYALRVEEMAAAMSTHGIGRGDTVGIM
ncbi:MAG: long-chain fatty acid--CoA ligase, partial [Actinobacteria bacterium]|nr:long-chain fatty acid--CoA ligase [Actinomycetota bacterium]